ncbi:hypothetical protein C8J57DRAFT_1527123 [Mycena rebaudengoi]|nr:hypothetical protein C8J57DRAFT_1527123 [Mycena rebaudengoi]
MFHQLFIATVAAIALVQAVDVCAWTNTLNCDGTAVCCLKFGVNQCCGNIQQGFGFSISYSNLPGPVSDGQAWTSINCRAGAIITQQIGTGNKCWVGAGTKANSMAWTHAASKRSAPASECAAPDVLKFTDIGVQKAVRMPSTDGALKEMIEFVKANNFTALAAYTPA